MSSAPVITRANVLGYRAWAQGLDRRPGGAELVLALGVQDTPHGSARNALVARGFPVTDLPAVGADRTGGPLVTVWSWRGAPHLHHRADPPVLATGLWPLSDADAQKRIATTVIRDGARRGIAAFAEAATAMREVVTERMLKGEVSTQVSARVPADLSFDCPTCRARHISGSLFQQVGLAAGVQVGTEGRNTYLSPLPKDIRPKTVPGRARHAPEVLRRYLEVLGPASAGPLAEFLGTTRTLIKDVVPSDVSEVTGPDGKAVWIPEGALDRLRAAEPLRLTRLLPPSDPWLQARDRALVVPDEARRKAVWGAIGNPGVLLVDGEVIGTWRAKTQRKRLLVNVNGFESLTARVRKELAVEAELLAQARELDGAELELG